MRTARYRTLLLPVTLSISLIHSEPLDTDRRAFDTRAFDTRVSFNTTRFIHYTLSMGKGSNKKKGRRTPQLENEQASPEQMETPPRPQKPTTAKNAAAIAAVDGRLLGMDGKVVALDQRLAKITDMLTRLTSEQSPRARQEEAHGDNMQHEPRDMSPDTVPHTSGRPGRPRRLHPYSPESLSDDRPSREEPHRAREGWVAAGRSQRRAPVEGPRQHHHLHREPPTTVAGLEEEPGLAQRVADAINAAVNPLKSAVKGKHEHGFPYVYVTRGPKRVKAQLDECTLAEYTWGFIQMIKNEKDRHIAGDMENHLEQLIYDARTYPWESVRSWSEEVCARVQEGSLSWCDYYEIDRLQTRMAHANGQSIGQSSDKKEKPATNMAINLPQAVLSAKPAPPCRAYQMGTCRHPTHHVTNGFRQIHICEFCLTKKVQMLPHSQSQCKSKQFYRGDEQLPSPPGFGN